MAETDWNALAERCEAAGADEQHRWLTQVAGQINPMPPAAEEDRHGDWLVWRLRFITMRDAEAYESAALMLVPEGWFTKLAMEDRHSHSWRWELRGGYGVDCGARAATPALALLAACCRAHLEQPHD